jgi:four helix bundle protein
MEPFERLVAWKESYRLTLLIYEVTDSFPANERFGLTSQMRRAAFSVPANIAEGSAMSTRAGFRRYLGISRGSLAELGCALMLAKDRKFLTPSDWERANDVKQRAGFLVWRLYRSLGGNDWNGNASR